MGGVCFHGIHSLVGKWQISLVQMDQNIIIIQGRPKYLLCACGRERGVIKIIGKNCATLVVLATLPCVDQVSQANAMFSP